MGSIVLVNPRGHGAYKKKRKSSRTKAKRKSTRGAAPMARRKRKAAKSSRRRSTKRRSHTKAVRRVRRRTRKVSHSKRAVARRRKNRTRHIKGYYPNPIRRSRRRRHARRSNPVGGMFRKIPGGGMIMPAVTGAVGAVGLDVVWAYLPIPANLKTGNLAFVTKAVGALGLTWALGKVVKKSTAEAAGIGMLTVVGYQWIHGLIATRFPQLKMAGLGYYSPGMVSEYEMGELAALGDMSGYTQTGMSAYDNTGMGAYVSQDGTYGS